MILYLTLPVDVTSCVFNTRTLCTFQSQCSAVSCGVSCCREHSCTHGQCVLLVTVTTSTTVLRDAPDTVSCVYSPGSTLVHWGCLVWMSALSTVCFRVMTSCLRTPICGSRLQIGLRDQAAGQHILVQHITLV